MNGVNTNDLDCVHVYSGTGNYAKLIWLDYEIEELGGEPREIELLMSIWDLNGNNCPRANVEIAFDL